MKKIELLVVLLIVLTAPCFAIPNPAAVYCRELGYNYEIKTDRMGNQYGLCVIPDGPKLNAWDFFKGKVGQNYSYCAKQNYEIEIKNDKELIEGLNRSREDLKFGRVHELRNFSDLWKSFLNSSV